MSDGTMRSPRPAFDRLRYLLMAAAAAGLLLGMWAGLMRLGWGLPALRPGLPGVHGALMVGGFLGTLIGVERAVALGRRWSYTAPALSALGALALLALPAAPAGAVLLTLAGLALLGTYAAVLRIQTATFTVVMALGAGCWFAGNLLWLLGTPIFQVVLWWAGFLVLTIAGERLELNRLLRPSPLARGIFVATVALFVVGLAASAFFHDAGAQLIGLALLALALWLLRNDVARRTIRRQGLVRYSAVCLLIGYCWLLAAGSLALFAGAVTGGPRYDALLHMIFLGFVFSMIFAHAPIILPAITGLSVPFRRAFYGHVALLHLSLALRIGSDLLGWLPGRQWGGLLNVVALLLFMANTAWAVAHAATAPRRVGLARSQADRQSSARVLEDGGNPT